LKAFEFPGAYRDARGEELIIWHIQPSARPGWVNRYEIQTTIRAVAVWGGDFDALSPSDPNEAGIDALSLEHGDLTNCVLVGDLPCEMSGGGPMLTNSIRFVLDLRPTAVQNRARPGNLELSALVDGTKVEVTDDWFEEGLQRLESQMPAPFRLKCCVTCLYSDYSPAGHGLMGMRCHRGAKAEYLAVRSKHDYWAVPVTEDVPETYVCEEYARRIPGTGYRG